MPLPAEIIKTLENKRKIIEYTDLESSVRNKQMGDGKNFIVSTTVVSILLIILFFIIGWLIF